MRRLIVSVVSLCVVVLCTGPAAADYRVTRDHGGLVETYKTRYVRLRERGERVIIDGICNSACTLVLGIVPLNRICVTPKASLGFHQAYTEMLGFKMMSYAGTADLLAYYPQSAKDWIQR